METPTLALLPNNKSKFNPQIAWASLLPGSGSCTNCPSTLSGISWPHKKKRPHGCHRGGNKCWDGEGGGMVGWGCWAPSGCFFARSFLMDALERSHYPLSLSGWILLIPSSWSWELPPVSGKKPQFLRISSGLWTPGCLTGCSKVWNT